MNVREVGSYIRKQRKNSSLTLKSMSGLAGVSGPYLSQIERGLRRPSADILQAIAKALRISAETLYIQAGMLEDRAIPDVSGAIMGDPTITERQKQALLQIYQAFREEAGLADAEAAKPVPPPKPKPAGTTRSKSKTPTSTSRKEV
jgi:transcriptional regulator with XRE-family HTH domain